MARNKTAKRSSKRHAKGITSTNRQKMEKELFKTPAKVAAKISKEISDHKQKENKLKKAIEKIRAQARNAEARIAAASSSTSSNSKKQLNKAKKAHKVISKSHTDLDKQLQHTTKIVFILSNEQAKWFALNKHLSQFNKDWAKNKTKSQTSSKPKKIQIPQKIKTTSEQPQGSNETVIDQLRLDETEVVS